jgi:hypothetical protein
MSNIKYLSIMNLYQKRLEQGGSQRYPALGPHSPLFNDSRATR